MVILGSREHQELQDLLEVLVVQVVLDSMDNSVHQDPLAYVEIQVRLALVDLPGNAVIKALRAALDCKDQQDRQETPDPPDNKVNLELMEIPEHLAFWVNRAFKELVDSLGQREEQDLLEQVVNKGQQATRVQLVTLVLMVNRELAVTLALKGSQVNQVLLEIQE